jgi:hypothetical protein
MHASINAKAGAMVSVSKKNYFLITIIPLIIKGYRKIWIVYVLKVWEEEGMYGTKSVNLYENFYQIRRMELLSSV